jgi:hypothetical protein
MLLHEFPDQPGSDERAADLASAMQAEGVDATARYETSTGTFTVTTPVSPDPRAKRIIDSLLGR